MFIQYFVYNDLFRTVRPINSHVTVYEASGNGVGSAVLNLHHFLDLVIDPLEKVQLVLRVIVVACTDAAASMHRRYPPAARGD